MNVVLDNRSDIELYCPKKQESKPLTSNIHILEVFFGLVPRDALQARSPDPAPRPMKAYRSRYSAIDTSTVLVSPLLTCQCFYEPPSIATYSLAPKIAQALKITRPEMLTA
jgi:hypothetical protein